MDRPGRRPWKGALRLLAIALFATAMLAAGSGCARRAPDKPPAEAFALSASALSGDNRFAYTGEAAAYDGQGVLVSRVPYGGEVTHHRLAALSGAGAEASTQRGLERPLELVSAAEREAVSVAYAPERRAGEVSLRLVLSPGAAQRRMREALRDTLPAEALRTLHADTVVWWTADRRTWFPIRMREESVVRYRSDGRDREERRTSVTDFHRTPDSDTIRR
ncbi:hypothetical protein [Cohnella sp. REN36]|uniref:hypothetical protein n=1 Tax=Cohnella sp. REN36 TaxID=2887347 RepID=UPI001D152A14|nr:hypothetical protein [Cohnella sp. REN36]MCC3372968.1 hypothetical protein [Cohnella sp. REN36]